MNGRRIYRDGKKYPVSAVNRVNLKRIMTCEGHDKPCVATWIVKATSGDEASLNADKAVTN